MCDKLTASEALFGFCGWLTTRKTETVMSSTSDASAISDLIKRFCETNKLDEPREFWADHLTHPTDEGSEGTSLPDKEIKCVSCGKTLPPLESWEHKCSTGYKCRKCSGLPEATNTVDNVKATDLKELESLGYRPEQEAESEPDHICLQCGFRQKTPFVSGCPKCNKKLSS